MIDERFYADLVDLYNSNVKAFIEQNTGLIVNEVRPLEIEDVEKVFDLHERITTEYVKRNYLSFTVNPLVTEMNITNGVTHVEISPDISWERQLNNV